MEVNSSLGNSVFASTTNIDAKNPSKGSSSLIAPWMLPALAPAHFGCFSHVFQENLLSPSALPLLPSLVALARSSVTQASCRDTAPSLSCSGLSPFPVEFHWFVPGCFIQSLSNLLSLAQGAPVPKVLCSCRSCQSSPSVPKGSFLEIWNTSGF